MANTIRIKRRTTGDTGAPGTLAVGELAYNEMDDILYIGKYNNNSPVVVAVGGLGEVVSLSNINQTIAGVKTFSSHPIISATQLATSENSTKVATTAWVKSLNYTTNTGTVTSVALSLPNIFTVTVSPVTTSGTLTATLASQTANYFFAAPNGSAGTPTFRAMVAADVPTLNASKISDFDTQVRTSRLDQMAAPTADVSFNSRKITGLADPTNGTDAANKNYVDSVAQGLDPKGSVKAASTANVATLSGTMTIDGIALVAGNRVLLKDQSTASQNGVYVVSAGSWSRATDANTWDNLVSAYVFVEQGTTNADNGYLCTVDAGGTLGTTDITFVQFTGAGQISAGNGLTKTGNTIDAVGTTNRITVNANSIDIASTYVGQSSITTLGTITAGTWQSTDIGVAYGGTGVSTLTSKGIVYGNGTSAVGVTAAGAWDSTNSVGEILSVNSSGTPVWTNLIDGGTF